MQAGMGLTAGAHLAEGRPTGTRAGSGTIRGVVFALRGHLRESRGEEHPSTHVLVFPKASSSVVTAGAPSYSLQGSNIRFLPRSPPPSTPVGPLTSGARGAASGGAQRAGFQTRVQTHGTAERPQASPVASLGLTGPHLKISGTRT